ncbi:MAG: GNAT family N-acetyltransferase [Rhodopirellula sp.]|nr:GNAT family N-acetyltransferase [Rhodopirellula sp.]
MQAPAEHKYKFPLQVRSRSGAVIVSLLSEECRESMIAFARALPQDDLLFLERDISNPHEVDRWIEAVAQGTMVSIVARQQDVVVGYATFDRGRVPWTRHVAELRVVVASSARGGGIGRLLLEMVFEMSQQQGVRKVIARMTPEQTEAQRLFKRLGFEEEAVLRDNAMDAHGVTHDLLLLSFRPAAHEEQRCAACGVPVLMALALDGAQLCTECFEMRYEELGGG